MKKMIPNLLIIFTLLLSFSWMPEGRSNASNEGVGKVILLRGKVVARNIGSDQETVLKKGDWLKEGATIETGKRSFTKILFKDKSTLNVGPESSMLISSFPEKKSGIITLIKGRIRSEVNKDLRSPAGKKGKSKFFIKTKTAAMGVRGTMWDVTYNPINKNTTTITFRGQVAMAKLHRLISTRKGLDALLNSKKAVLIHKGQFSTATEKNSRVTIPVKLSPAQFETLKKNDDLGATKPSTKEKTQDPIKADQQQKKRAFIPPGVDQKDFVNATGELDKLMEKSIGKGAVKKIVDNLSSENHQGSTSSVSNGRGSFNRATGAYAPPAGGIIDMRTGIYIKPPPDAKYDANTKTYIVPKKFGGIDPTTGDYRPPETNSGRLVLLPDGSFSIIKKLAPTANGRSPASTGTATEQKTLLKIDTTIPQIGDLDPTEIKDKTDVIKFSAPTFTPPKITPLPIVTKPPFLLIKKKKGRLKFKVKPPI